MINKKSYKYKYANCRNMYGFIVNDSEIINKLEGFFNNPCIETWEDVYSIVIGADACTSFWQCVLAIDKKFPKHISKWITFPDYFTARRALVYAQNLKFKEEVID